MEAPTAALVAAVAARHAEIRRVLRGLDEQQLRQPSCLPGWDRLTIVCHLRYGAATSRRMTDDAIAGRPTAFYPRGREGQRASSLAPMPDESPLDVVAALDDEARRLDERWSRVDQRHWQRSIEEPEGNRDLGPITLETLALLRLTEVEVHGTDLDLGCAPWSDTFVVAALPMRLGWLPSRRSNHRGADRSVDGSWAFVVIEGPSFLIEARGGKVEVQEHAAEPTADSTFVGTGRQLLAFILGRESLERLQIRGDRDLAASFLTAFPAP